MCVMGIQYNAIGIQVLHKKKGSWDCGYESFKFWISYSWYSFWGLTNSDVLNNSSCIRFERTGLTRIDALKLSLKRFFLDADRENHVIK